MYIRPRVTCACAVPLSEIIPDYATENGNYARILLSDLEYLLCSKYCRHKIRKPTAGSATGCVNPRSKNKVVPSSLLENVDADKPLPRRYSLGMDEFVDKSAYTSSRRSSSRHRRLTVQLYCPAPRGQSREPWNVIVIHCFYMYSL